MPEHTKTMTDDDREAQIRATPVSNDLRLADGREPDAWFLLRRLDEARAENADTQRTFDLMWKADQRAIKAWQDANPGNEMVWPDRAKLTTWLLERAALHDVLFADALASSASEAMARHQAERERDQARAEYDTVADERDEAIRALEVQSKRHDARVTELILAHLAEADRCAKIETAFLDLARTVSPGAYANAVAACHKASDEALGEVLALTQGRAVSEGTGNAPT